MPALLAFIGLFTMACERATSHKQYSGSGQPCLHAQPCRSEQPCVQGWGCTACLSARVLLLLSQSRTTHRELQTLTCLSAILGTSVTSAPCCCAEELLLLLPVLAAAALPGTAPPDEKLYAGLLLLLMVLPLTRLGLRGLPVLLPSRCCAAALEPAGGLYCPTAAAAEPPAIADMALQFIRLLLLLLAAAGAAGCCCCCCCGCCWLGTGACCVRAGLWLPTSPAGLGCCCCSGCCSCCCCGCCLLRNTGPLGDSRDVAGAGALNAAGAAAAAVEAEA
jgi:hypothetical protein